jgi:ADP-heptose:LPS heptosyltransferase
MMMNANIQKVAIFRALQLGDLLCCIPAVRALKLAKPSLHITLIGLPWAQQFVARFSHYFDDFITFPGYPGLPEQPINMQALEVFLLEVRARKFDLLLQMQGNGTIVNPLLLTFGAQFVAGFDPLKNRNSRRETFLKYPDYGHETERHIALMEHLGVYPVGSQLEFPVFPQDITDYEELNLGLQKGKYICVHAGSRGAWRQWPPLFFAGLADLCSERGYTVVLTGTTDEMPIVEEVAGFMKTRSVIAAGKTTLGSLAVLIGRAAGIICNCTGVAHIASALEIPSVVISMDGEPWRWAPQDVQLHKCIDWTRYPDYTLVKEAVLNLTAPESSVKGFVSSL